MNNQLNGLLEVSIRNFIFSELNSNLNEVKYRFIKNNTAIEFSDKMGKMVISIKDFLNGNYSSFK